MIQRPRVHEARNSLIQGNDSAAGKDQHGHYKGPEVEFLAVTERMRVIGRLSAFDEDRTTAGRHLPCQQQSGCLPASIAALPLKNAAVNFEAAMIGLAPMATRIAIGFWSIAPRVTAMSYTRRKCLPRKNSVLR